MTKRIAPVLTKNLIVQATSYLDAMKPTKPDMTMRSLSRMAHGDPPFFDQIIQGICPETGRVFSVTLRKYDEVIAWFDNAAWPEGYKRPELIDPRHGPSKHQPKKAATNGKAQKRTGSDGGKAKPKKSVRAGE